MSNKRECPGCGSYTSSVLAAFEQGQDCPYCGLSATAAEEVEAIHLKRGNQELKNQLESEIKARHAAEQKARKLERIIDQISRTLGV